jgi:hypothetical protein
MEFIPLVQIVVTYMKKQNCFLCSKHNVKMTRKVGLLIKKTGLVTIIKYEPKMWQ